MLIIFNMIQRMKKYYFDLIVPQLISNPLFAYKNKQQVPRIQKIVINRGLGEDRKSVV